MFANVSAANMDARKNAVLEEIRRRIVAYLLNRGLPKPDAEDIGHSTVIVLLEKPDVRFDPPPIGLAIATAKNKLLEHYRKGPTYPPPANDAVIDPAGSALQGLLETADREEKVRRLEAVLQKLGSPCREITRWKMEGAKAMEIADRLKMGVNAVEVQAHRCLRRIQTLLVELKSGSRV